MFRINPASGKAIYEQIMEQVKEAKMEGLLKTRRWTAIGQETCVTAECDTEYCSESISVT